MNEISAEGGSWIRHIEKGTRKLYYKPEKGLPGITIYYEEVMNTPVTNLLPLVAEAQLY